jgi:hypothetical protein
MAVQMPYNQLKPKKGRKLGLLMGKSSYAIKGDFQIRGYSKADPSRVG